MASDAPLSATGLDDPMRPFHVLAWPLWAFVTIVMTTFVSQSAQFEKPGQTMATIAGTVLSIAYVGLLGSFLIQTRWLGGPREGLVAVLALVATAKGADTGAFTIGRLAGRHKLWPRLSPNKTIEGACGGMVLGVLAAVGVLEGARQVLGTPQVSIGTQIGYGLLVGAAAQLGDLMESMIKRDCESKDASETLPGFGGLLDVMDSLLFAAPFAYVYWLVVGL
jgi:phosphatidate cytidylyltransferase